MTNEPYHPSRRRTGFARGAFPRRLRLYALLLGPTGHAEAQPAERVPLAAPGIEPPPPGTKRNTLHRRHFFDIVDDAPLEAQTLTEVFPNHRKSRNNVVGLAEARRLLR